MRVATLLVAVCLLPIPAFAQANQSFLQGFGGLRIADAPTATPIAGATVGIGLLPHLQVVGEFGHMRDVLPSTVQTLLTLSPVSFRRSAWYGEGGVRLTTSPVGHVGAYGEALAGAARITNTVNGLDPRVDAITNVALRFVNTTDRVGAVGTGVILQGGPVVATVGYRFTRIFSSNRFDTLLMGGDHSDVNEARVSFGVRF